MSDFKEREQRKKQSREFLLSLIEPLKAAGIVQVMVFYDGEGDSGSINSVRFFTTEEDQETRNEFDVSDGVPAPSGIEVDKIEDAADAVLPDGYAINEGGFGTLILDVTEGKIKVNHANRIQDWEAADYEV